MNIRRIAILACAALLVIGLLGLALSEPLRIREINLSTGSCRERWTVAGLTLWTELQPRRYEVLFEAAGTLPEADWRVYGESSPGRVGCYWMGTSLATLHNLLAIFELDHVPQDGQMAIAQTAVGALRRGDVLWGVDWGADGSISLLDDNQTSLIVWRPAGVP